MKAKGFKLLSTMLLAFGAMLCGLVGLPSPTNISAAGSSNVEENYHMKTAAGYVETANHVGNTSGYGKYKLGESATLTATANEGYNIVAWKIDNGALGWMDVVPGELVKTCQATSSKDGVSPVTVTFTGEFIDNDNNGAYESAKLTISEVFDELKVTPIYGYNYYNVDATNMKLYFDESITFIDYETYTPIAGAVEKQLTDKFVKDTEGKIFYFENLYYEEGGKGFYVYQNGGKVDCLKGAYTLNEEVEISAKIKEEALIQATGMDVVANSTNTALTISSVAASIGSNSVYFGTSSKNLTNEVSAKFNILSSSDLLNELVLNYHQVYTVELVYHLDGAAATGTTLTALKSVTTVENYVYNEGSVYYVKEYTNDPTRKKFTINASDYYYTHTNDRQYLYYDISSIMGDNVATNEAAFKKVFNYTLGNRPSEIIIGFTSHEYNINFKFALQENGVINDSLVGNFNVNETVSTIKGDASSVSLAFTNKAKNTGYEFVGFALNKTDEPKLTLTATIDNVTPEDITYLMVYKKIEYTLNILNANKIGLNSNTVRPNPNIIMSVPNKGVEALTILAGNDVTNPVTSGAFVTKLTIDDMPSFTYSVTDGFILEGLYALNISSLEKEKLTGNSIKIDSAYIEKYVGEAKIIDIYLNETYAEYTLNYVIEETSTGIKDEDQNLIMEIMAAISLNGTYTYTETKNADNIVTAIKVTGLHKFDTVKLKADAFEIGTTAYYKFVRFTADGVSALDGASVNKDTQSAQYDAQVIVNNSTIKVVYSMPTTMLSLDISGYKDAFNIDNVVIEENGNQIYASPTTPLDYTISAGAYVVKFENTASGSTEYAIAEGAYIKSIKVTQVGTTDELILSESDGEFSFTISNPTDYKMSIEIGKYEYEFTIYENSVEIAKNITDIQYRTLQFNKIEGYYVSEVYVDNHGTLDAYTNMNETNDTELSEYYRYVFETGELESFIGSYGERDADSSVYKYYVDLHIVRTKHVYNVTVYNPVDNAKKYNAIAVPEFNVTYKNDAGDDVVIEPTIADYNKDTRSVTLYNIPYNTPFVINVKGTSSLQFGVEILGWRDQSGAALNPSVYTITDTSLATAGIKQNQKLYYAYGFVSYNVQTTFTAKEGNPIVQINDAVVGNEAKIRLLDKFYINANPNIAGGFTFDYMEYYTVLEYTYTTESKWNEDYNKLYVRQNNVYVLNTINVYNNAVTYYQKVENIVRDGEVFSIDEFNPSEFFVDANGFFMPINFKLREVNILNISECDTTLAGFTELNIPTSQFASYVVSQYMGEDANKNPIYRQLDDGELVNRNYSIRIDITINDNAQNGALDEFFDLRNGVYLETFREDGFIIVQVGHGVYCLIFNMSDVMDKVVNDELIIKYQYFVQDRELVVTTNVYESTNIDLLNDFNTNVTMSINYGEFGSGSGTSGVTGKVTNQDHYLAKTTVTYTLVGSYSTYIRIYDLVPYDIYTGARLSLDDAGIEINRSGEAISSVTVRYLRNVKLVFIVTPLISVNGHELSSAEVPPVVSTFMPDANGFGKEQATKFKSLVETVPIVKEALIITYTNELGLVEAEPKNKGTYDVALSFNTSSEGLQWLNGITISSKITFVIEGLDISVTYDATKIEKIKKQYNQKSDYSASQILDLLIFTDNKGFSLSYAEIKNNHKNSINSFVLNASKYRAFVSRTEKGLQVETSQADEKTWYNITLDGLELVDYSFNNNFNLLNSQLTIFEIIQITRKEISIGGIFVNDKVYDGTSIATLSDDTRITIYGICQNDDVVINKDKILVQFVDYKVGDNKTVTIDTSSAMEGEHAGNYTIKTMALTGRVVYPYELKAEVANVGNIIVRNDVGLTDPTKANLIPLNAKLSIKVIEPDSAGYAEIYPSISKYLSRTNVFSVGFRIAFENEDGTTSKMSKELSFAVPTVENLTGVICLDGTLATEIEYEERDGLVYLNLANLEGGISDILLTEKRALLPLWAIILIVVGGVALVGGGVTAFILIRRKKTRSYSVNDKI